MSAPAGGLLAEASGVSKWYRSNRRREWLLARATGRYRSRGRGAATSDGVWALENVSLRLERGRSLGVVGDNGAGKTTLLRILAGISRPTSGSVAVHGRIATRFGLGLSFNPYLSGRENVFLEGTLLGMTNRDVRSAFDEIVEFAGLNGAIDRPLWTYSSGMVSRLGFAIATRVEADVLLLDEALSAGDGPFRQRSEQVLLDARAEGRSLIVVSHGLALIRKLCDEGLWLEHGRSRGHGEINEVVDAYELEAGIPSSRPKDDAVAALDADAG